MRTPADLKPLAQEDATMAWGRTLLVESARDGFDAEVVRRVIPADEWRSTHARPQEHVPACSWRARSRWLASAGKPANVNIDDAMQHVLDAQKPADAKRRR